MDDVRATLAEVEAASARLTATVDKLTDDDLRAPSRLPGWTRGHVVAHLARNADSCWNLLEWARTGAMIRQYPDDRVRDTGIEANSGRPAAELRAELRVAVERFALQAATLPATAWRSTVAARSGWTHPAWYVLYRRWREVEAHHLDLDFGYRHTDWSAGVRPVGTDRDARGHPARRRPGRRPRPRHRPRRGRAPRRRPGDQRARPRAVGLAHRPRRRLRGVARPAALARARRPLARILSRPG